MLELYKNIKRRRIELGMSQQELAEKTGYKNKSMISMIEQGKVNLPNSKIKEFAGALRTNVVNLQGWFFTNTEEIDEQIQKNLDFISSNEMPEDGWFVIDGNMKSLSDYEDAVSMLYKLNDDDFQMILGILKRMTNKS